MMIHCNRLETHLITHSCHKPEISLLVVAFCSCLICQLWPCNVRLYSIMLIYGSKLNYFLQESNSKGPFFECRPKSVFAVQSLQTRVSLQVSRLTLMLKHVGWRRSVLYSSPPRIRTALKISEGSDFMFVCYSWIKLLGVWSGFWSIMDESFGVKSWNPAAPKGKSTK